MKKKTVVEIWNWVDSVYSFILLLFFLGHYSIDFAKMLAFLVVFLIGVVGMIITFRYRVSWKSAIAILSVADIVVGAIIIYLYFVPD